MERKVGRNKKAGKQMFPAFLFRTETVAINLLFFY